MKKIIALVLCVLLIGALAVTAFAAEENKITVTADKTEVKPGDTVKIAVSITSVDKYTSIGFKNTVSDAFEVIGVYDADNEEYVYGEIAQSVLLTAPILSALDQEGLALAYTKNTGLTGDLCTFEIKIKDNAPVGAFKVISSVAANKKDGTAVTFVLDCPDIAVVCEHTYGAWTEDGTGHKQVCSKCGDEKTAAHEWNAGEVTTKPDCKNDGVKTFTCTICSATKTEAVAATGAHNYANGADAGNGNHTLTCTGCGDTKTEAHKLDNGTVTAKPTCKDTGVKTFKCTACNYTKEETLEKTDDHKYGAWTDAGENHKKVCSVCTKEETAAHAWGEGEVTKEPTCKEEGTETFKCADCGATKTDALPVTDDHQSDEWTKVDGNTHKGTCSVCDKEVTVDHEFYAEFDEKTHWGVCACGEKTEAEAHVMIYDYNDELHVQFCEALCGYHTEVVEHKWDEGTVTKKPTTTAVGEKTFKCECGATKTEEVAKIATPATGDNNMNAAFVVLAVMATCGLALSVIGKKRFAR